MKEINRRARASGRTWRRLQYLARTLIWWYVLQQGRKQRGGGATGKINWPYGEFFWKKNEVHYEEGGRLHTLNVRSWKKCGKLLGGVLDVLQTTWWYFVYIYVSCIYVSREKKIYNHTLIGDLFFIVIGKKKSILYKSR